MKNKACLVVRDKWIDSSGNLFELVIWQVPRPVPPAKHHYKYRLVYVRDGKRVIGFDNERGKGDHMHRGDFQIPYNFHSIEKLVNDFLQEVEQWENPNAPLR